MTAVVDLRFMGPYAEPYFGPLYGVSQIVSTTVKTFFTPLLKNVTVHL
jgi:hypothetical protein